MNFSELTGKTLSKVEYTESEEIHFTTAEGVVYRLYHKQDCCENVEVEDICGDFSDLIGSPLLGAEEVSSSDNPDNVEKRHHGDYFTWTFYKLHTVKGYVTIRWYGESNGYYSEKVDFEQVV